jgi:hypothetical protein
MTAQVSATVEVSAVFVKIGVSAVTIDFYDPFPDTSGSLVSYIESSVATLNAWLMTYYQYNITERIQIFFINSNPLNWFEVTLTITLMQTAH